jgi:enoyl-CoA hydratase/carnithine racemase
MGGGLGIASACDYRVGTEKTRIAMPEITIGLIPDAGATYSFMQMPTNTAHFLALTGAQINGQDAHEVGFVNYLTPSTNKDEMLARLKLEVDPAAADANIKSVLAAMNGCEDFPPSALKQHANVIDQVMTRALDSDNPVATLLGSQAEFDGDPWLEKAIGTLVSGAPTTAQIILEQFARARSMNLKQMLMQELTLASQCSRHPDFAEGVRALLIDKDAQPRWHHASMGGVPADWITAHFTAPWAEHPLEDLDESRMVTA